MGAARIHFSHHSDLLANFVLLNGPWIREMSLEYDVSKTNGEGNVLK